MNLMNFVQAFGTTKQAKQIHQLPPIVQVTVVAIDEDSASKLQAYAEANGNLPPDYTAGLFSSVKTYEDFLKDLGDPANPGRNSLIYKIANPDGDNSTPKLNYRVFTTDVVMRGAKWSK